MKKDLFIQQCENNNIDFVEHYDGSIEVLAGGQSMFYFWNEDGSLNRTFKPINQ